MTLVPLPLISAVRQTNKLHFVSRFLDLTFTLLRKKKTSRVVSKLDTSYEPLVLSALYVHQNQTTSVPRDHSITWKTDSEGIVLTQQDNQSVVVTSKPAFEGDAKIWATINGDGREINLNPIDVTVKKEGILKYLMGYVKDRGNTNEHIKINNSINKIMEGDTVDLRLYKDTVSDTSFLETSEYERNNIRWRLKGNTSTDSSILENDSVKVTGIGTETLTVKALKEGQTTITAVKNINSRDIEIAETNINIVTSLVTFQKIFKGKQTITIETKQKF